ncbi:MAG: endolytic transglycosylase MltG [Anaerolineales bacterium]|nr:endolytic transglycosylase MltG [Anaerolineales bacterium]
MASDPQLTERPPRRTKKGCGFALLLVVIVACLATAVLTYGGIRWQRNARESGIFIEDASPDLGFLQRLMLQNRLVNHSESLYLAAGSGTTPFTFTIAPGETADSITQRLSDNRLINDSELFLNYLRFYGLDGRLQAGEFTLDPRWSIPEMAAVIADASAQNRQINIFAGMRLEETAAYLTQLNLAHVDPAEFLAITRREVPFDTSPYPFLATLPADTSFEGYLMPGLYSLPPDADAIYLIQLMLQNFDQQVTPTTRQAFGAQGLSLREGLTLASIIAKEALVEEERPLIAGVYLNRFNDGTLLQADPTVQYALGYQPANRSWWKNPLTLNDLQVDNPYNTYLYLGLPPGPIASPGPASIRAAANPTPTDYYFFVLDCDANTGEHIFSTTFEEHLGYAQRCQ